MTEKKSWGSTVKGWFLVPEEAAAAAGSDGYRPFADIADPAAGNAPSPDVAPSASSAPVFVTKPPAAPGGAVDFDKVFEAAGIDTAEGERITRTLQLLASLPASTDPVVRKQIVMASLQAFGVPIEKIIETGAEQLQALDAYIRTGAEDTAAVTNDGASRIKRLEDEIATIRKVMQERVEEQNGVIASCNAKKLEVQKVLEFFGQDAVARVVRESPKLQEPGSEA
ncbi:MAG: hypothetical protein JWO56_3203 [Acidobacteria bacterium]|nr:hypothetical protein [Acidobacteriota bacterium]